jgi:para-nitrobenzyl esterase
MPAARGLFDRAILQSGAAWLIPPERADATALARDVLAELGTDAAGLADVPAARLVAIQERLTRTRGLGALAPYIDGETIPRVPTAAVRDGDGARVPLLLGSNRDEWTLFDVFFGEAAAAAASAALLERFGDDMRRIHAAYRDDRAALPARGPRTPEAAAWIDVLGDVGLRLPVLRLADAHTRHAPAWMYRFDWESPAFGGRLGAAHALELPFTWNHLDLPISQLLVGDAPGARELGAQIHDAWAAFIRDGAPAASGLPAWPRYDEPRRATMVLDRAPHVADDPDGALPARWSALVPAWR